jgi:hypothetical protein
MLGALLLLAGCSSAGGSEPETPEGTGTTRVGTPSVPLSTSTRPPSPPPTTQSLPTTPPPPPTSSTSNCDPSYPTVCIPPHPPDLDCGEIHFRRFTVLAPDPHGFDADFDGVGCESG